MDPKSGHVHGALPGSQGGLSQDQLLQPGILWASLPFRGSSVEVNELALKYLACFLHVHYLVMNTTFACYARTHL